VDRHVSFLGDISDDQLRDAYARAWCFALPTRRVGTGDVEGFGIVYLEAAMAELPSVGGLNSGAEDAIADGKSGLLVDGSDPAAIASAIGYLLSDPDRARALGRFGRSRALTEFSWRLGARKIMQSLGREPSVSACSA
jgi:phosphatidylinositol alpha-1,6-mannosyltransferase